MWNRHGLTLTAISLGLAASLVSYQVAYAVRNRDYTPRELRSVLHGFGYNIAVGDAPLTDAETRTAIRQFQQGYKIQADGVAGARTQDLAADLVRILQANLNLVLKPSPALPRTQYYGPLTEAAVRRYQQQAGLPVTGIATLAVRKSIDDEATRILNNQTPAPSAAPAPTTAPEPTLSPSPSPVPRTTPSPSPSPVPRTTPSPSPSPSPSPLPRTTPSPSPSPSPGSAR
jgi:peptidoglycan hydrolase-like protein with peptidoglycan-binding domain